ncbi:Ctf8p and Ctf18p associating protein [Cystobasidiomycetes sp. EMM_F5]
MAGIHYLQFSDASSSNAQVSYSLLELPAALLSQLDAQIASGSSSSSWVIKGQPQDDAVLCTYDETYNVRGVQNSNSLLLCQPSVDAESDTFGVSDPKGKRRRLDIQGTLHQTLELEKAIPRLDRLTHMLRNHEWSPDEADTTNNKNVLSTITVLGYTPASFDIDDLSRSLHADDGIPIEKKPVPVSSFMAAWKEAVGEQLADICDPDLLEGLCLVNPGRASLEPSLVYFPVASLPTDPALRFSELFSARPKWKVKEIAPFLVDLAIDSKKRDAITLKFTRKVKGDDGEPYYAARVK